MSMGNPVVKTEGRTYTPKQVWCVRSFQTELLWRANTYFH